MPMQTETYTPTLVRAIAGAPEVVLSGTIKKGQDLEAGDVVALETASGKLVAWASGEGGGAGHAVGVLMHNVDASSAGLDMDVPGVPVMVSGYVRKGDVMASFATAYTKGLMGGELPGHDIYYFAPGPDPS